MQQGIPVDGSGSLVPAEDAKDIMDREEKQ